MTSPSFLRHAAFFGPEDSNDLTLNIIGVGATGSWIGLLAAKMGWHHFRIWDLDVVESHNLPNQIYGANHIGMKKVDAFEQVLKSFNPQVQIEKYDCFYESEFHSELLNDIVIIAVDSLSARKDIATALIDNFMVDKAIETRMGFTHAEVNVLDPVNKSHLQNFITMLKNDDEVSEAACNERIITTLTNMIASFVVHRISDFASADRRQAEDTLTPSKTVFSLTTGLKTYDV